MLIALFAAVVSVSAKANKLGSSIDQIVTDHRRTDRPRLRKAKVLAGTEQDKY
jgi:hypothetical protein